MSITIQKVRSRDHCGGLGGDCSAALVGEVVASCDRAAAIAVAQHGGQGVALAGSVPIRAGADENSNPQPEVGGGPHQLFGVLVSEAMANPSRVHITHEFKSDPQAVFDKLAEHENLGPFFGAGITRVSDGSTSRSGIGYDSAIPGLAAVVGKVLASAIANGLPKFAG